jgi:hypothetical protein
MSALERAADSWGFAQAIAGGPETPMTVARSRDGLDDPGYGSSPSAGTAEPHGVALDGPGIFQQAVDCYSNTAGSPPDAYARAFLSAMAEQAVASFGFTFLPTVPPDPSATSPADSSAASPSSRRLWSGGTLSLEEAPTQDGPWRPAC